MYSEIDLHNFFKQLTLTHLINYNSDYTQNSLLDFLIMAKDAFKPVCDVFDDVTLWTRTQIAHTAYDCDKNEGGNKMVNKSKLQ